MKKVEIITVVTIIIGVIFHSLHFEEIFLLLVPIPVLMLALLYLFLGFALFNGIRFRNMFTKSGYGGASTMNILSAIGLGLTTSGFMVAILFRIQRWPFTNITFLLTTIIYAICIIVCGIQLARGNKNKFYTETFVRSAFYFFTGILFLI